MDDGLKKRVDKLSGRLASTIEQGRRRVEEIQLLLQTWTMIPGMLYRSDPAMQKGDHDYYLTMSEIVNQWARHLLRGGARVLIKEVEFVNTSRRESQRGKESTIGLDKDQIERYIAQKLYRKVATELRTISQAGETVQLAPMPTINSQAAVTLTHANTRGVGASGEC
jgi:hypothetical protein